MLCGSEVAVTREEMGAVYNVNWRGKKRVHLHVNLGSRFFFVLNLKKYSDLSGLLLPGLATGICYFHF